VEERTLRLTPPFGGTLLFSLLLLVILLAAGEFLTRTDLVESHFISASRGSPHFQFELQLGRLERMAAMEGSIDCIFLGNSMVGNGFDPIAFSRAYRDKTGSELHCFNFGVDALPVTGASGLAQYFIKEYQPKLLIYGADARDFAVGREDWDAKVILDIPWMNYQLGTFSVQGWLYEYSQFYRYARTFGYLLMLDKQYLFIKEPGRMTGEDLGFYAKDTVGSYVSTSPALNMEMAPVRYYFQMLSDLQILPENTSSLEGLLNNAKEDLAVAVVVMPVPETYHEFFSINPHGYRIFLDHLQTITSRFGNTIFIPPHNMISEDGWADYTHLNTRGAAVFSTWLGQQLGESVLTGQVSILSR
jgi:hypothetical protein